MELPSLRPGGPPDGLEIEGRGLELLSARKQANKGAETVWLVRLRAAGPTGNLPVVLRALYPDGRSVGVHAALTVVPPREEGSGFPWAGVVVGAGLAAALAAGVLLVARRKA